MGKDTLVLDSIFCLVSAGLEEALPMVSFPAKAFDQERPSLHMIPKWFTKTNCDKNDKGKKSILSIGSKAFITGDHLIKTWS